MSDGKLSMLQPIEHTRRINKPFNDQLYLTLIPKEFLLDTYIDLACICVDVAVAATYHVT